MSSLGTVLAVLMYASRGRARTASLSDPAAAAVLSKEQGVMVAPILLLHTALFERNLRFATCSNREFPGDTATHAAGLCAVHGILLMGMSLSTNYNPAANAGRT